MGKETKVGLLVGMSFIVCVAIVLSHRGDAPAEPDPLSFEIATVLSDAPVPPVHTAPETWQAEVTRPHVAEPAEQRRQAPYTRQVPPLERDTLPGSGVLHDTQVAQATPERTSAQGAADAADRFSRRGAPLLGPLLDEAALAMRTMQTQPLVADGSAGRHEPLRLSVPQSATNETATATNETATRATPEVNSTASQPASATDSIRPPQPRAILAKYVVQPNDTLGYIAQKHYGTSRGGVIEAIFAANRQVIPSPDRVVVGREIVIPALKTPTSAMPAESQPLAQTEAPAKTTVTQADTTPASRRTCVPESGETLSHIAKRYYDSAAPKVVNAIYEANRDRMSNADHVVAGRELRLPVITGYTLASSGTSTEAAIIEAKTPAAVAVPTSGRVQSQHVAGGAADTPGGRREGVDFVWYQLEKGDVYSTVAAKMLGTATRWKELADYNADIFPDPARIRWGVKIRIPVAREGLVATRTIRGDV